MGNIVFIRTKNIFLTRLNLKGKVLEKKTSTITLGVLLQKYKMTQKNCAKLPFKE